MSLGSCALGWIACQEASPLTCVGSFKAVSLSIILRSTGHWENGNEGSWIYMADFLSCSCRMSAMQCLKHEWLNNLPAKARKSKLRLKSQLLLQSYMAHRKWKVNRQSLANLLPEGKSAQHRQSHSLLFCVLAHFCPQASSKYEFGKSILSCKLSFFSCRMILLLFLASLVSIFTPSDWCLEVLNFLYNFRDFRCYLAYIKCSFSSYWRDFFHWQQLHCSVVTMK